MDTKQIEYILKIAEENNITRAASKLFITQSALNQQLIKLEKELGTPLFHRSRTNWHLTEAGEIYVKNAKEMLRIKNDTYQMIHDLTEGKCGHLSVGFTAGRGITMFTSAYSIFHQQYPNIVIEPKEGIVRNLQKLISQGDLDIGFLTLTDADRTDDIYETVYTEELFLAVPSGHPVTRSAVPPEGEHFATLDPIALQYEPFVLMDKHSTMRTMVDQIFDDAGFEPQILFETGNNHTILSMIQANMCCGILTYYYVKDLPDGITFFRLPSRPTWEFTASYKKGRYLSDAARCFIDLMKEQWGESMNEKPLKKAR
ncbi:MAG: LysR family transcriptional regulator [Lachnospiraceae bacterium]|nr:LysR family transcriptional regulator [Lachnospiraceae bacterium]